MHENSADYRLVMNIALCWRELILHIDFTKIKSKTSLKKEQTQAHILQKHLNAHYIHKSWDVGLKQRRDLEMLRSAES